MKSVVEMKSLDTTLWFGFFKDSPSVRPAWLLMDGQDC